MGVVAWIATGAGVALVLLALVEVLLTVLHMDLDGPVAGALHRGTWGLSVGLSRRLPRWRRGLLAMAGPLMMVVTFLAWVALFVFGFALIVWPHLGLYRSEREWGR